MLIVLPIVPWQWLRIRVMLGAPTAAAFRCASANTPSRKLLGGREDQQLDQHAVGQQPSSC